jgi:protein-L-isoaspartate(D-aspartate) O-methyltransferase
VGTWGDRRADERDGWASGKRDGLALHATDESDGWAIEARHKLVRGLERRGIRSRAVLAALAAVPRERFVTPELQSYAYADRALPIALDQTISQPYIVALMSELADVGPGRRVLEIGTGCGYQTAVLAALGTGRVHLFVGDGHRGLPEFAPYDAILVTAAPERIPRALVAQLAPTGRLIVPIGAEDCDQELVVVRRTEHGEQVERVAPVRFVPMTGGERGTSVPATGFGKV